MQYVVALGLFQCSARRTRSQRKNVRLPSGVGGIINKQLYTDECGSLGHPCNSLWSTRYKPVVQKITGTLRGRLGIYFDSFKRGGMRIPQARLKDATTLILNIDVDVLNAGAEEAFLISPKENSQTTKRGLCRVPIWYFDSRLVIKPRRKLELIIGFLRSCVMQSSLLS